MVSLFFFLLCATSATQLDVQCEYESETIKTRCECEYMNITACCTTWRVDQYQIVTAMHKNLNDRISKNLYKDALFKVLFKMSFHTNDF